MPFDDPRENQDEMQTPPRRFGYPFVDDEDDAINPAIALQPEIAPTFMPQRRSAEPQVSSKPGIGQQIVAMGNREMPPFDIQDGRAVWRNDPATLPKPNIGQRIVGMAPSRVVQPTPLPNFNPSQPRQREQLPYIFPRSSSDQMYGRQELFGASTPDRADRSPNWRSNSGDNPSPSSQPTVSPVSSSRVGPADRSVPGFSGQPEYLRGPLDFNEFASFLGARRPGFADNENRFSSNSKQEPRAEAKSGMPDSLGTVAGKAVGAAAQGALGAVGQQAQQLGTQKPPVKGSVGRDGENDPLRVKALQKMLNEAIEVGQLTGPPLEEDGKVSEAMLKLLDSYQRAHKLPKERLVTENSWTARRLKQNPLADARWDGHDQTIKSEVDSFNKSIKQKYPDFPGLDWRQIKAMLWQESGGPDKNRGKEWAIWPMQIGRRKADLAIEDVISGESHTDLIAPKDVRKEIANAYRQHRMTPTLNIRAAIIYLCGVAISGLAAAKDAPKLQAQLGERQSLSTFANGHGTTVENLRMLNPKIKGRERLLRPETQLTYQVTKPVWGPWELALHNYNSETRDPDYVKKILRYYEAIKKRWSADSIVSSY